MSTNTNKKLNLHTLQNVRHDILQVIVRNVMVPLS